MYTYTHASVNDYKIGAFGHEIYWAPMSPVNDRSRFSRDPFDPQWIIVDGVCWCRRVFSTSPVYVRDGNERWRVQRGRLIWRIWRFSNAPVLLKAWRRCKAYASLFNLPFPRTDSLHIAANIILTMLSPRIRGICKLSNKKIFKVGFIKA